MFCFPVFSILFFGCKKEEVDEDPPNIFLEAPFENQTFSSVDTIEVVAVVTDDQNVSSIEVELLTLDNQLITKRQFNFSGTEVSFAYSFEIDQPLLASGQYYFALRARDGVNRSSSFRQILINAIPREIEQYIVATTETNSVHLETSNDLQTWINRVSRFMDYNGCDLNYKQNIVGIVGGDVGDAEFYNTAEFEQLVSYPGFGIPSIPFYLGLDYSEISEKFVLLQNDPQARLLDQEAQPLSSTILMPNFLPSKSFGFDDRYFVLEKRITNNERFLNLYSFAGLRLKSFTVLGPVIGIFEKDLDEYFVWVDEENRTVLYELNTQTELFAPVYERSDENLLSVVETDNSVFIFSTDQGIYRYTYFNGGTNPLNDQFSPNQLVYDDLNGLVYGMNGESLYEFSTTGQFIRSIEFNRELVFFGIDYNR